MSNVPKHFNDIPRNGVGEKLTNLRHYATVENHVQGYTQYQNGTKMYYILTHSWFDWKLQPAGRILVANSINGDGLVELKTNPWAHPGGCQCIGQFLFVPLERDGGSIVQIYDLADLKSGVLSTLHYDGGADKHNAGCLGIVDFKYKWADSGAWEDSYLLIIGASATFHAYVSRIPSSGDMRQLKFSKIGTFYLEYAFDASATGLDFQGFGLVADTDGSIYMVGLYSRGSGTTFEDWGFLIKLSITDDGKIGEKPTILAVRPFNSDAGGGLGKHFRYGVGIRVTPDGKLVLLATSRNIASNKSLNATYWVG